MWRLAKETEDELVAQMCLSLYEEDPGPLKVVPSRMCETLMTLRREPWRGRAVVLELVDRVGGYALLISFWSNELGGEVCQIDELYVAPELRNRGYGTSLFNAIGELWPTRLVAIALGVTPGNADARRLYERLGFAAVGVSMVKRLLSLP